MTTQRECHPGLMFIGPGRTPRTPTLGERIVAAQEAVEAAEKERGRLIRAALDRGASTRQIAELLPVNHSTVWRWGGGKSSAGDVLNEVVDA